MVNASTHSQANKVDVFVECSEKSIDVFIRDTGVGFDQAAIADDRRGISESIVGRMKRSGGTAVVDTEVGEGTEIELSLPVPQAIVSSQSDKAGMVASGQKGKSDD